MADRVHSKTVTCPANTPTATPLEVALPIRRGRVERIEIRVPGGHAFLTGIALLQSHGQTIPFDPGDWLIGEDDRLDYQIEDRLRNGAWSALVYNTDPVFAHGWYIRFSVAEVTDEEPGLVSEGLDIEAVHAAHHAHHAHPRPPEDHSPPHPGRESHSPAGTPGESSGERREVRLPGRAEGRPAGRERSGLEHHRNV